MNINELSEKHPYLVGIGSTTLLVLLINYAGAWLFKTIGGFLPIDTKAFAYLCMVALALAMCLLNKKLHKEENYKGVFTFSKSKNTWIFILVALLAGFDIVKVFLPAIAGHVELVMPTLFTFCLSLAAAVCEETMFRAIPISLMMRKPADEKRVLGAMLLSGVLFGAYHFSNLIAGAALDTTIVQVIDCIGFGCIAGAIYLRTGSILPTMIWHFITDFFTTMIVTNATGLMTNTGISIESFIFVCIMALLSFAIALFMLRKSKREEVLKTWKEKWGK